MTTDTTSPKLYIAYGANVSSEIFKQRCPNARLLGTVTLRDYSLVFRGVADMVRANGRTADCVVWELTPEDEAALDQHESVPSRYAKRLIDLTVRGERRTAIMYVMNKRMKAMGQQLPFAAYEQALRAGYAVAGIAAERIDDAKRRAIRWCEANEIDPTEERVLSRVWTPVQGEVVINV